MRNFNNYDLLEIIEAFATDNRLIESEEMLSNMFDQEIAPGVIEHYGDDDQVAIDGAFNDWADSLCKEGEIHPEQCYRYCYVGKYSDLTTRGKES